MSPCSEGRPPTSNVNYDVGQVVPNAVLANVGTGGKVCIFSSADAHILMDVSGFSR